MEATGPRSRGVIVTGGSGGIGGEIAARFAAHGDRVVVLDRAQPAAPLAHALAGHLPVDLADPADALEVARRAVELLGGVEVLVNCAGVFRLEPILEISVESWDRILDVNARACLLTMQAVAPTMISAGTGRIVNIASMAAKSGGANEAHYAASKAAVVALTRAAAQEWGPHGVTVNAVCPGYVLTQMGAATRTEQDVASWSARSPLGRLATPGDVAGVVAFLASEAGSYLTGQAIDVSGGMVMH